MSGEFDTPPVPASEVNKIYNSLEEHLEEVPSIDHSETAPLGSTRSILHGTVDAPDEAGDIDLLVLASDNDASLLDVRADLHDYFDDLSLPNKHFFKNIFSVAFESEETDEPVQVDLVISERDSGRKMYRYLRDLKYFSSPRSENFEFRVKGLHRTELIRSFCRALGLSMATEGFSAYVWAPDHDDYSGLMERLEDKHSRTRKEENLELLEELMEYLEDEFSSLDEIRSRLFNTSPLLKRKFLADRAGVGPVDGKYAAKTLERELTNARNMDHIDWEMVLKEFVGVKRYNLISFRDTLESFSSRQFEDTRVRHAILDYKSVLSNDGYWNEDLEGLVEDEFSVELNS